MNKGNLKHIMGAISLRYQIFRSKNGFNWTQSHLNDPRKEQAAEPKILQQRMARATFATGEAGIKGCFPLRASPKDWS